MVFAEVGKRYPRADGEALALGEALFVDDLKLPGMLYGLVLRAPCAHGRVLKVDTRGALASPGVAAILTAADIPHNAFGSFVEDQPVLAGDRVRYLGDPVAALAAESLEDASRALEKIEVEYEELPAVFDPEEALLPDAPIIHEGPSGGNLCFERNFIKGNPDEGFREADIIFEGSYSTPWVEHASLETHICLARPEAGGRLTLWASTQRPFIIRSDLARVLGLPLGKIRVITQAVGGAFGGKHKVTVEPLAALFALRTGRPVKMAFSREEEFTASTVRHPFRMDFRTGVRRDGVITAREVKILADSGAYCSWGASTVTRAGIVAVGPYDIPHVRVNVRLVYTNNPVGGAVRGLGVPQAAFGSESHTDTIASELGLDPLEFRLKNALKEGDTYTTGQRLGSLGFRETIERAGAASGWGKPLGKSPHPSKSRGRGVASMLYGIGYTASAPSAAAIARMDEDGTITVFSGAVDAGQGAGVALAQIAAEELGIGVEEVELVMGDTGATPYDQGSSASRVTHDCGNAVRAAASELKAKLLATAGDLLEAPAGDLTVLDGRVFVRGAPSRSLSIGEVASESQRRGAALIASGSYTPVVTPLDPEVGEGSPYSCYVCATQVAEVEVDRETGEVRVLRLFASHDVGTAINPMAVEGQVEGGVSQGLGFALMEEIIAEKGKVANSDFTAYLLPTALDLPERVV
ncbi:MAG: xanthine dehydrogenase family protein molybdopterin-binding subunit, partial [Nitrospinota bacterium]